jgi:alpha-acetolactate decarboxylase/formylmethanofuran dehydrogenase subunit E
MKKSIIVSLLFVAQISFAQPVVKYRGAMSNMGAENFKGNILIDTLSKKNLFGIGPYGKMQGEITIVNGKPLIAQVQSDGNIQIKQSWQAEAPFFVYANVIDWQKYEVTVLINTLSDIQPVLENLAKEKGYPLSIPFPFRIESDIDEVTTHVVTPRSAEIIGYQAGKNQVDYTYQNTSGELIGFYSQQHQGVYTSKKTNIHIHYVSDDMTVMGHVDKILIAEKRVTIYLPSKSQSTGRIRIKTNDTDFSKGRLGHIQEITLDDVAKFHGHLCDGLVVGFLGLREALYKLYPDSIVDRTNTRIVSNPSPCMTDVGVYLTGGRYQFNTFYIDEQMKGMFTVTRIDNNEAYQIKLKPGIKPTAIDSLGTLAAKDQLSACDLDGLKKLEDHFTTKLLSLDAKNIFEINPLRDFKWSPKLKNDFIKTDVLNKDKGICK